MIEQVCNDLLYSHPFTTPRLLECIAILWYNIKNIECVSNALHTLSPAEHQTCIEFYIILYITTISTV